MTATRPPMLAADYIRELTRPYLTSESVTQPVEGDDGKWRYVVDMFSGVAPPAAVAKK